MRLLRIRVKDFRGIREREIEPLARGVTVVQGPNEVGKSSLAEAVDLLFDALDSSASRQVASVRPEGRDVGAEVELEAESGPYRFTYFKRFHKDRETRLTLTRPRPEELAGREAHQRAWAILEETMDVELWRALRVQQGEGIAQAELAASHGLAEALDRAAGGSAGGEREETLFARAREEHLRYCTPTGRVRKERAEAREQHRELAAQAQGLEARYRELEAEVETSERLAREVAALRREAAEAESEASEGARALAELEGLEAELAAAEDRWQQADQRWRLLRELAAARRELAAYEAAARERREALEAARAALEPVAGEHERASEELRRAEELAGLRRGDEAQARRSAELTRLRAAASREAAAAAAVEAARTRLAELPLDAPLLARIEAAEREVEAARTARAAGSPRLRLAALAGLGLDVDGEPRRLEAGEELEIELSREARIAVPDLLSLTLEPGTGARDLQTRLEASGRELARLLEAAGVADPEAARARAAERREAETRLREAEAEHRAAGAAGGSGDLEARVASLAGEVESYRAARPGEPAPPEDGEAARRSLAEAEARLAEGRRALERAAAERAAAEEAVAAAERAHRQAEHAVELGSQRLRWAEAELAKAGVEEGEGPEPEAIAAAEAAAVSARAAREAAAERLAAREPEGIRSRAAAARAAAEARGRELADRERELRDLRVRLKALGEQGLFEAWQEADARLAAAERQLRSVERRAAAAETLYRTLDEERDASRAGYRAPLARTLAELGRPLFGDGFAVELDEELRITHRLAAGHRLAWEQLSAGAREQLSILARLAAALLVAPDGGVPLILDDTLGHSDPERLAAMGQVLEEAGRRCQVIVLTCHPQRFRHLGKARVVELTREEAVPAQAAEG